MVMSSRIGIAGLLLLLALPAAAQDWAGVVKTAQGHVSVERVGQLHPLNVGDRVYARDKLVTGKDGQVGVTLRDDTLVSAGPNSRVGIAEFSFEPTTQNGGMMISVLRGVTAMVSGLVAKSNPAAMRVTTPTATMGIRGTEFIVEVDGEEE